MRSTLIIVAGLVLFGAFAVVAWRAFGGVASVPTAAKLFIALWLVVALANLWVGVARAGYTVTEELPVFLVIFGIPAAVAAFAWSKLS